MPSNHLILCHPLLLLTSVFPSIRVFSNESALCIRWPKYKSFSFSISTSNEHSRLISFRMDWFDLLVVQGTLKRLLQLYNSKASIVRCSELFMIWLWHPYMIEELIHPQFTVCKMWIWRISLTSLLWDRKVYTSPWAQNECLGNQTWCFPLHHLRNYKWLGLPWWLNW